ncbi:MAG TPA: hypothetical protein VEX13_07985 [Chloroflexia bacterium]|nr:hypothetical protein [Chloroflexia bacterium]
MFGFVQWDSPLTLLIEVALSIAVLAALMWVARRVNAASTPPSRNIERQPQDRSTDASAAPQGTQEPQRLERQPQHERSNE